MTKQESEALLALENKFKELRELATEVVEERDELRKYQKESQQAFYELGQQAGQRDTAIRQLTEDRERLIATLDHLGKTFNVTINVDLDEERGLVLGIPPSEISRVAKGPIDLSTLKKSRGNVPH